jgi:hypothetical protein
MLAGWIGAEEVRQRRIGAGSSLLLKLVSLSIGGKDIAVVRYVPQFSTWDFGAENWSTSGEAEIKKRAGCERDRKRESRVGK